MKTGNFMNNLWVEGILFFWDFETTEQLWNSSTTVDYLWGLGLFCNGSNYSHLVVPEVIHQFRVKFHQYADDIPTCIFSQQAKQEIQCIFLTSVGSWGLAGIKVAQFIFIIKVELRSILKIIWLILNLLFGFGRNCSSTIFDPLWFMVSTWSENGGCSQENLS